MARSEVVRRCCKLLDNFDESLILPALFWAGNPPENSWVSIFEDLYENPLLILMKLLFCRRIIKHGTACLRL
jgi:hypothetical protein